MAGGDSKRPGPDAAGAESAVGRGFADGPSAEAPLVVGPFALELAGVTGAVELSGAAEGDAQLARLRLTAAISSTARHGERNLTP
jgi:hypothetical protein